jgi:hypothetical protein
MEGKGKKKCKDIIVMYGEIVLSIFLALPGMLIL